MWWYYIKKLEDEDKVIYLYGRETKIVSGELIYNKKDQSYSVIKPADGDDQAGWALQHLHDVIKAECPEEHMVAIG